MRLLLISTDRAIFNSASAAAERMAAYGELFDSIHIIVFAKRSLQLEPTRIAENVWAYPTNTLVRVGYAFGAIRVARRLPVCDIISTQDPFEAGYAGRRIARERRIPLQVQVHTDFLSPEFSQLSMVNRFRAHLAKRILPTADCIRVVSNRIEQSLFDSGMRLQSRPVVLPIPLVASDSEEVLARAFTRFRQRVLVVSRLEPEKDIETAIHAFRLVRGKETDVGLIIVGDGRERPRLERLASSLGVSDSVVFLGAIPALPLYRHADVFLGTSRYEGFGLALMEAAAVGCPIVTTDVGVVGYELPKEAVVARPVGDVQGLAAGVLETLRGGTAVGERATRARQAATKMDSWGTYRTRFASTIARCARGDARMTP